MIVPDVNLLLYAEIDAFPEHLKSRQWWEDAVNGTRQVGLPSVSLFGFLRISTNRRVFKQPLSADDAAERVETWLENPNVVLLSPGTRFIELALGMIRQLGTAANLTTDIQIAAHALEVGGEVYSNDADFGRFDGLRWVNPLAG